MADHRLWVLASVGLLGCGDGTKVPVDTRPADVGSPDVANDTPAGASCHDGIRQPGELCFAISAMPFATDGRVDLRILDADGQGGLDVVALMQVPGDNGEVRVALNPGTGVLSPLAAVGIGRPTPLAMATGTMDANTSVDISIATPDRLVILRNDGAGGFGGNIATVSFGATALKDIAIGELEGDSDLDVLLSNADGNGSLHVMNSNNGTSYGSNGRQTINATLTDLELFDIDGDHDLDVVGIGDDGSVHVVTNNGTATYTAAAALALGANPRAFAIADLDGDGDTDAVVVVDPADVIVLANSAGTFTASAPVDAGGSPFDLAIGDVDGDADLDLVVSDGASDKIAVLRRDGASFLAPVTFTVGTAPREVAVADLNGDGIADIVALLADGQLVTMLSDP
jgi:hypothetical protein